MESEKHLAGTLGTPIPTTAETRICRRLIYRPSIAVAGVSWQVLSNPEVYQAEEH
jgi:hypothetical protein